MEKEVASAFHTGIKWEMPCNSPKNYRVHSTTEEREAPSAGVGQGEGSGTASENRYHVWSIGKGGMSTGRREGCSWNHPFWVEQSFLGFLISQISKISRKKIPKVMVVESMKEVERENVLS